MVGHIYKHNLSEKISQSLVSKVKNKSTNGMSGYNISGYYSELVYSSFILISSIYIKIICRPRFHFKFCCDISTLNTDYNHEVSTTDLLKNHLRDLSVI